MYRGLAHLVRRRMRCCWPMRCSTSSTRRLSCRRARADRRSTIITPSELTRLKQGDPTSKELEAKAKDEPQAGNLQEGSGEAQARHGAAAGCRAAAAAAAGARAAKTETPPRAQAGSDRREARGAAARAGADARAWPDARGEEEARGEARAGAQGRGREEEGRGKEKGGREEEGRRKEESGREKEGRREKEEARRGEAQGRTRRRSSTPTRSPRCSTRARQARRAAIGDAADQAHRLHRARPPASGKGNDTVLSAREQDLLLSMINSQLEPCAKLPGGGGGIETPIVNVRFRLNQDGSLDGEPVVVDRQNRRSMPSPPTPRCAPSSNARRSSCRPTSIRPGAPSLGLSIGRSSWGWCSVRHARPQPIRL